MKSKSGEVARKIAAAEKKVGRKLNYKEAGAAVKMKSGGCLNCGGKVKRR